MKKALLLLTLSLLSIAGFSQVNLTSTNLSVSPTSLEFSSFGETKSISVTSNKSWTTSDKKGDWFTLHSTKNSIQVIAKENTSQSERKGSFVIKAGDKKTTISLSQKTGKKTDPKSTPNKTTNNIANNNNNKKKDNKSPSNVTKNKASFEIDSIDIRWSKSDNNNLNKMMLDIRPKIFLKNVYVPNNEEEITLKTEIIYNGDSLHKSKKCHNSINTTINNNSTSIYLTHKYLDFLSIDYFPGSYLCVIWYNGKVIYEKSFYVPDFGFEIDSVRFENSVGDSLINDYGSTFYANDMRYLYAKAHLKNVSIPSNGKQITLCVKIINPDGSLNKGEGSTNDYTYCYTRTIYNNTTFVYNLGWGSESKSNYKAGKYGYEIWYEGNKIYSTNFTIEDFKFEIDSIHFNKIITGTHHSKDVGKIDAKVFLKNIPNYLGKTNITLYMKVYKSNGSLLKWDTSLDNYTFSHNVTIDSSYKSIDIPGWYIYLDAGIYKYEIWYNEKKIYSTNFTLE